MSVLAFDYSYCLYLNELPSVISSSLIMFTDDIKFYHRI